MLNTISALLSLLYNTLRFSRDFIFYIKNFFKNREIKRDYEVGKDAVKDGDIEKINDIINNK